jgi:L-cysteine S-thiosulfotransferase
MGWLLAVAALLCLGTAEAQTTDTRQSGYATMAKSTQALQDDDTQNPAFLWVKGGERLFNTTCTRCHSAEAMRSVATKYPAWDTTSRKAITLQGRISACRVRHAGLPALPAEHEDLLSLEAFVALQSRGLPIAPNTDKALVDTTALGARLWQQRLGQLDLSCAQCHDQHAGGKLAGSSIPQGHPTGYPLYRLEWQGLGSLQRRLRNCMSGVRAEPFAYGSDEFTALELYMKQRAAGMRLDSPGVRP